MINDHGIYFITNIVNKIGNCVMYDIRYMITTKSYITFIIVYRYFIHNHVIDDHKFIYYIFALL